MSNAEQFGNGSGLLVMELVFPMEMYEGSDAELPNMTTAKNMAYNIRTDFVARHFPDVSEPLPGRYSDRSGEKLHREELYGLVDGWLDISAGHPRFVIQGGNRYISRYVTSKGVDIFDIKLSSIDKAPLSHHLLTLMMQEEADQHVVVMRDGAPISGTRAELLGQYASDVVYAPFSKVTQDQTLETELADAVRLMREDGIELPNLDILRQIVAGTEVATRLSQPGELHLIDDLFYRRRTIYSLGNLIKICGGRSSQIRLTTIGCDPKSRSLTTPYHHTLRADVLYPFENSVRTEQGYWQDVGDKYEFTDMGAYLEYLHQTLSISCEDAMDIYQTFHTKVLSWGEAVLGEGADPSLVFPLAWLIIYHDAYGLIMNTDKIVDQKGYKIGACAPFMALLDRFVSQEETVEVRQHFKHLIRHQLDVLLEFAQQHPKRYQALVAAYKEGNRAIDYGSLAQNLSI